MNTSKKIFFYTKMNFGNAGNSGIFKKVIGQWKALNEWGYDTVLFYTENENIVIRNEKKEEKKTFSSLFSRLKYTYHGFVQDVDILQFDVMYFRHFFFHPLAVWMLFWLKWKHPNLKIVMELPTYPYRGHLKIMDWKGKLIAWLDKICSPSFKKYIDLIATFSSHDEIFGIKTIQISNGIDPEGIQPLSKPIFEKELHILGLANVQAWHGYDRIIEGLKEYYSENQKINVLFHLVGEGDAIPHLKQLTKNYGLENKVLFYGPQFGDNLNKIMSKCHLAASVLGFQRAGAYKGTISSLKVREYCLKGIPFINGYPDSDIKNNFPFVYEVNPDETFIEIPKVIEFYYELMQNHPNYPQELHDFALKQLSWKAKFEQIAQWINNQ